MPVKILALIGGRLREPYFCLKNFSTWRLLSLKESVLSSGQWSLSGSDNHIRKYNVDCASVGYKTKEWSLGWEDVAGRGSLRNCRGTGWLIWSKYTVLISEIIKQGIKLSVKRKKEPGDIMASVQSFLVLSLEWLLILSFFLPSTIISDYYHINLSKVELPCNSHFAINVQLSVWQIFLRRSQNYSS